MAIDILVISGVSGVGKNSVINRIIGRFSNFLFVPQYTTRALRIGEGGNVKRYISDEAMDLLDKDNEFIVIRASENRRYAIDTVEIRDVIARERVPVLEWPLSRIDLLNGYNGRSFLAYLIPPTINELRRRIRNDSRDPNGIRLMSGINELGLVESGAYDAHIDLKVMCETGKEERCALEIAREFLRGAS